MAIPLGLLLYQLNPLWIVLFFFYFSPVHVPCWPSSVLLLFLQGNKHVVPNVKIYILANDQLETDSNMAPVACHHKKNFILQKINISLQITQVKNICQFDVHWHFGLDCEFNLTYFSHNYLRQPVKGQLISKNCCWKWPYLEKTKWLMWTINPQRITHPPKNNKPLTRSPNCDEFSTIQF